MTPPAVQAPAYSILLQACHPGCAAVHGSRHPSPSLHEKGLPCALRCSALQHSQARTASAVAPPLLGLQAVCDRERLHGGAYLMLDMAGSFRAFMQLTLHCMLNLRDVVAGHLSPQRQRLACRCPAAWQACRQPAVLGLHRCLCAFQQVPTSLPLRSPWPAPACMGLQAANGGPGHYNLQRR